MSNEVFLNPSLGIDTLFPTLDDESFLQFLKEYYKWLQSTKITLSSVTGTPVQGEIVIGARSNARGLVKFLNDTLTETIVLITTDTPFEIGETLNFQTSGATAIISSYKDNVLRESARIQKNRNQKQSGEEYLKLLKDELNRGYPSTSEAERREIFAKIRDLYKSKSTEEAYRFLFKAFFDENIEIRFPGDDLLRVSDGKFEKTSLIRVVPTNTNPFPVGGIFDFLNKTIRGQTSGAVGTVVNISISFLGGIQYAEFNLKLVSGEFEAGETVADVLQPRLSTEVFGVIGDIQINDGGSGYSVGDAITITGDGAEATAEVSSVSTGPINRILINTPGYGYRLNTRAAVNNTDTGGDDLEILVTSIANTYTVTDGANTYTVGDTNRIQIINRGSNYQRTPVITLVDSTIRSLGLLSERLITIANSGTDYAVGEVLTFTGGSGNNAAGEVASVGNTAPYGEENILFEDDFVLVQEQEVHGLKSAIKSEDWGNLGSILRIELTNLGSGYASNNLPTLTLESANTVSGANATFTINGIQGASANVTVDIANNSVGIGSIRQIDIRNPGINYSSANIDATTQGDGNANLEAIISGLNVNRGFFTNDDGKISFKIIQDSFFYQDFSYVIRSGLIIDAYKELVKETVHPAGLEFFGEIVITSIIALTADFRSQIDQTPRPLALRSFLSLYPAGINIPYAGSIREVEITPALIDQALVGVNDFNIREIEITPVIIDNAANFSTEYVEKLYLYLDVALFPTFSDVVTDTIPTIPVELDYILSGISNIVDTGREYQIEIAPIRMEQPLAIRDFNVREIEIVKNIDAAVNIDRVKTFDFFADQFGEYSISFFAETLISTYSANTFLDFSGLGEEQTFKRRIDTQGLEIDIELPVVDLQIQEVPSTSYGTENEVPLFVSVPLIRTYVDEIVNRLEIYLDVSAQIVLNDVQILETAISDVVIQVFSIAQDTIRYDDVLISQLASEQISAYASTRFKDTFVIPLSPARTYQRVEVDIELPLVSVIASVQPFRIFVDRLRLPSLGLGISIIDASINFEGTSYEIDVRPDNIFSTLRVIPQNTGRVKTLRYFVPPLTATIPNIYEVIKIQPKLDVAPIPRMKLEIDVPPGFTAPFKETIADIQIATLASEVIQNADPVEDYSTKTFLDDAYRYKSLSKTDIDYRIEIYQFIDSRMRFYSEILTMTNREMTVELEVFSGPVDVSTRHGRTVTVNYFNFGDVPLVDFANQTIFSYASTTFGDPPGISFTREVPSTFYEIDIEPVRSQVVSLFIPTELSLGNTVRYIDLYIDSRMSFYSEILSMTNRVHTTEIDIFSFTNTAAVAPQETPINYIITPSVIDVSLAGVRDFNIREIEITPATIDLRMAFYTEIYTMTNRVHTTEIEIQSGTNVAPVFRPKLEIDIPINPRTVIGEERIEVYAEELIQNYELSTFNDSVNRNAVRLNTASEVIKYLELAVVDLRMAFYSEIYTMTNRIHTTEIEIQSGPVNVAASTVRTITFGVDTYGKAPIELFASNTIAEFNGVTTDSSEFKADSTNITADEFPITFNTPVNLTATKQIPSSFYELEIPFYKEVTVNVDRAQEVIKEIELPLEQVTSTAESLPINRIIESDPMFVGLAQGELTLTQANRLEVILASEYGEALIRDYASDSISKFSDKTFVDDIALGSSAFNEKFWTFDELTLRAFENDPIENFGNDEIEDVFANKNIQKNVKIEGTVTFTDPGFAGTRLRAVAGIEIDTYSANTLNDLSGSNTSVFGTNTEFTVDYLVNESLITSTEKFLVTTVANNTYLEINVNPEENYNDASVYREYFV